MIASAYPVLPDLITCALFAAICFVAGVAWAAYRAIDWADRIRLWAMTEPIPEEDHDSCCDSLSPSAPCSSPMATASESDTWPASPAVEQPQTLSGP